MRRVASGVSILDRLLEGGLPSVPDIIVSGLEEDIRSFSQRILWHRLNAGDFGFYGTISRLREEVYNDFISQGWDVSSFLGTRALKIVDFFYLAGDDPMTPDEGWNTNFPANDEVFASQLVQIFSKELVDVKRGNPHQNFLTVFESLEKLVALIGLPTTLRVKQKVLNLVKDTNSTVISLLCTDFPSDTVFNAIKAVTSVFIEIKRDPKGKEPQYMIRITKSPHNVVFGDWIPCV